MSTGSRDVRSDRTQKFDWGQIRRRLQIVGESLASAWKPSPEEKKLALRARAMALSHESQIDDEGDEFLEVVEFTLAIERYGIQTMYVREVYPLKELTPLPGTPPFVLGVMNVRGRILSVLDLKKFFELPEKGLTELDKVIVLYSGTMEFGILADAIVGVRTIPLSSLQPALATLTGIREDYLKGLTPDRVVILSADKLLADASIIVHQEVEIP